MRFFVSSLLFLEELGKQLFVSDISFLSGSPFILLRLSIQLLSSKSLFCDESLDLWSFVESLFHFGIISLFDFLFNSSLNNVLSDIILLSKSESASDMIGSFWTESSWLLFISEASNFTNTFLEYSKENNSKVWSTNATSHGLSLSLTSSSWSVKGSFFPEKNFNSSIDKNSLFHGESLFVVSTSNSEGVSLEFISNDFSINVGSHSTIIKVTIDFVIIDFLDEVLTSGRVRNIVLHMGRPRD